MKKAGKPKAEGQWKCIMDKPIDCFGQDLKCGRCHNFRYEKFRR